MTLTLTTDLVFVKIVSGAYLILFELGISKIVSENDQEIPQSQTADNPLTPRGRAAQQIWCDDAMWDDKLLRTIIGSLCP